MRTIVNKSGDKIKNRNLETKRIILFNFDNEVISDLIKFSIFYFYIKKITKIKNFYSAINKILYKWKWIKLSEILPVVSMVINNLIVK